MTIKEFTNSIDGYLANAIEIGKQVSGDELCLIPDIQRIDELDEVIGSVKILRRKNLIDDTVSWNVSVMLGTVLGEMIIRKEGFHWTMNSEDIPVVETNDHNQMSPITKIYKILLDQQECEGDARGFYEGFKILQKYHSMSEEEREKITKHVE